LSSMLQDSPENIICFRLQQICSIGIQVRQLQRESEESVRSPIQLISLRPSSIAYPGLPGHDVN
jgi:hypothetical protein